MSDEDRVSTVPSLKTKTETDTQGLRDQDSEVPRPRPRLRGSRPRPRPRLVKTGLETKTQVSRTPSLGHST